MPSYSPNALSDDLGEAMRAYQASVDDSDRETARVLGVNETDLRCLEILLQEVTEAVPSLLATRLGLTSGAVTTMLDRLERSGFIVRAPHPTDRRKTIVRATSRAAEEAHALIAPLLVDAAKELLGRYSADELKVIIDFTRRARALQERHTERLRGMETLRDRDA